MGDPKKPKKLYENPRHPWQRARLEEEKVLVKEFALKNKREIFKHRSMVKRVIDHYKTLNYQNTAQAELERKQLLEKVHNLGLVSRDKEVTAVLDMKVRDALERRLQTIVYKKHLARSIKQARQFIAHRHILVDGKIIDAPGFIVPVALEHSIAFIARSPLFSDMHPERAVVDKKGPQPVATPAEAQKEAAAEVKEELAPVEIEVEETTEEVL